MLYQDESSFQQSGSYHRSWAQVGVGFYVLSPPVRKNAKVMGAVRTGKNPKWHSLFVEWFNADSFIAFLKQLVRYYDGTKAHLITDNVPYHKAPKVRDWLQGKEVLNTFCLMIKQFKISIWLETTRHKPLMHQANFFFT